MTEVKRKYAYTESNTIVHYKEALKGVRYFLDPEHKHILIYKVYSNNTINHFALKGDGTGESPEHYNLKMKILKQGCFIYNGYEIRPKKIEVEYYIKQIDKRPDIAFFDDKNKIFCCIEVCHTNPKNNDDIKAFNKLDLIVYECYTDKKATREISNTSRVERFKNYIKGYKKRKENIKTECERLTRETREQVELSHRVNENIESSIDWYDRTIRIYQSKNEINDRG